jgi:hypothetical protein
MSLKRIMLLARIVRLGYNVLSIDAGKSVLNLTCICLVIAACVYLALLVLGPVVGLLCTHPALQTPWS